MNIKVDIVSGFLGAGKTRFIKKLINDGFYEDKVIIIENEFGEVNIDSAILKKSNAVIKEITAGCICCEVTGYFKDTLLDIIKNYQDIKQVIIEPTGIAKLSEIIKTFNDSDLEKIFRIENLFTVVDCEKFNVYMNNFRRFYVDQIKTAHVIVMSRVQLVDKETVLQVKKQIERINPQSIILDSDWNTISTKNLRNNLSLKEDREYIKNDNSKIIINKFNKKNSIRINTKEETSAFQSFTLKLNRSISKDELSNKFKFIASNKSFGTVIRAKGIVTLLNGKHGQFDFSLNEYNIESIDFNGENIISFIGMNLNKKELEHFFK